jgi:tripartite-type tricarboxylate transporter receptor subunit TctC
MKPLLSRRCVTGFALALGLLGASSLHAQAAWPTKPIRWIVPYPAGGPLDAIARKVADTVSGQVGQPILIENRSGAYGTLGASEVARAKPDGYTFLMSSADTYVNAMALLKTPAYDSRKDLTLLTQVAESGAVLMLSGDSPETTLAQLLARAKSNPGKVSYGSWGAGSYTHLLMEGLARQSGAEFLHVPYRGAAPAIQDLLGKQVMLAFAPANVASQFAQKGAVKLLAVSGESRSPLLPSVPTFQEAGYGAGIFRTRVWLGLAAPAGLPAPIADAMVKEVQTALGKPEVSKFIADAGFSTIGNTPAEFRKSFDAEFPLVIKMIQDAGVVAQ